MAYRSCSAYKVLYIYYENFSRSPENDAGGDNKLWIKFALPKRSLWFTPCTGDYVVIEQIAEGHKVQAEIVHILYQEQIKELKRQNLW